MKSSLKQLVDIGFLRPEFDDMGPTVDEQLGQLAKLLVRRGVVRGVANDAKFTG